MAVPAFGPKDRVGVVVGLMDWSGDHKPTTDDLAGRAVLVQAQTRFEAVSKTGGEVLGLRPLGLDGIKPVDPLDLSVGSVHVSGAGERFSVRPRGGSVAPAQTRPLPEAESLQLAIDVL